MAQIGTISLLSKNIGTQPGGVAFLLASPPTKDIVFSLENGEVEFRNKEPYVVVRFAPAINAAETFSIGNSLAQRGLDMMSILGIHDAAIRDAEDEHLIWWSGEFGLTLRAVSTASLKFTVEPVTMTVRDKDGKVVPPTPSHPRHHIAFRFFRLAQITDDLYDAYRNMYLAFEALLSSQFPKHDREKEIDWLEHALRSASAVIKPDSLGILHTGDIIETIIEIIYKDTRLPLFHAKEGRPYFAPQDSSSNRKAVSTALALLTQIVLRMAEAWFDARRTGGGVFFGWVYDNVRSIAANCSAYASSYDEPVDANERDLSHPRFSTAAKLQCHLVPELQRGNEPAILSVCNGSELTNANPLKRVELASESAPIIAHVLEAPLIIDGIQYFEDLIHIRGTNTTQPRSLFRM